MANRWEKHIKENYTMLNYGCSRTAYLANNENVVYKLAHGHADQTHFEKHLYEIMPKSFLPLLPKTKYFGRIIQTEYLIPAADDWEYFSNTDYIIVGVPSERIINTELYNYIQEYNISINWNLLNEFLEWLENQGGCAYDIIDSLDNVGRTEDGQFKILDWGYSFM